MKSMLKIIGLLHFLSCYINLACSLNDSSNPYNLYYWRDGNDIYLYCDYVRSSNNSIIFRINETDSIYFVSVNHLASSEKKWVAPSPLPELNLNFVKFSLLPQYEGIYFCGDPIANFWSLGVGPLVVNPTVVKVNYNNTLQIIETTNGKNTTIVCPVQLGKLEAYYFVQWQVYDGEWNNIMNVPKKFKKDSGEFSSLTILFVQDKDYKMYRCKVKVFSPIDGCTWNLEKYIQLKNKFDWKNALRLGFSTLGWQFILASLCFSSCVCQCCIRYLKYCKPKKCYKPFMVKLGSQDTMNHENCTLRSEVSEFETECFIDGLHLYKDQCIGTGVFGTTYKGTYNNRNCAAKMLTHYAQFQFHVSQIKEQTDAQERLKNFQDKCKFLEKLSHSNIVQHIATVVDPTSSLPIFVTELIDCNMKSYLETCKPKKLPVIFQLGIFLDISRGLSFLHSENVVHFDLCDENVLLDMRSNIPKAKISDFGVSTIISYDDMNSALNALVHRQKYYPPEEVMHYANYNEATDVYALGVLGIQITLTETQIEDPSRIASQLSEINLLKKIIMVCLQETNRPPSKKVVNMILSLKQ